jgi:hypothetical protein
MPKYVKMYCIIFLGKITVPYLTLILVAIKRPGGIKFTSSYQLLSEERE